MREILFRGQTRRCGEKVRMNGDKVPSNWVYGGVCQGVGDHSIIYGNDDVELKKLTEKWVVYTDTIGQFTGLTDTKGKKIFEGDILQYWNRRKEKYEGTCVVKYGEFNCSCCDGVYGWYLEDGDIRYLEDEAYLLYEVRGNIHDNPELLEAEDGK